MEIELKCKYKIISFILVVLFCIGNISYARENLENINIIEQKEIETPLLRSELKAEDNGNGDNEQEYDITLLQSYNYGEQKVALEWTAVTDGKNIADVAKVGDYIDYQIDEKTLEENYEKLPQKIKNVTDLDLNETFWRVIYNDGETVKIVSTDAVASTQIRDEEDYNWYKANPYSYGDKYGDNGGYGLYYQISQIAQCFKNNDYVEDIRSVDIEDLPYSEFLIGLKNYLGQTDTDDINIKIREEGFEEILDTEKHGDFLGIGGERNYDSTVATIEDTDSLYIGGDTFLLPNYYNKYSEEDNDDVNAVYYVDGTDIKLRRVYPKGKSITAGIKLVITLKDGIYQTKGNGQISDPWQISTKPAGGKYTVYQRQENGMYEEKTTTTKQNATLGVSDGLRDLASPDKPSVEILLIRDDGWNVNLTTKASDNGTTYKHKVISSINGKNYTSNEVTTLITSDIAGFSYVIDKNTDTDPGNKIMYKLNEDLKISRTLINTGNILHVKAIDNAGNESETLHMPLNYVFRDLNLFKTYKEATDIDETGIARTPGWNYVNIDWNPIELKEDRSELPDVVLVLDVSGSMSWNGRIGAMKSGAQALVDNLLDMYPDMNIGIVHFNNCFGSWWDFSAKELVHLTNDRELLKNKIGTLYASGENNAENGINLAKQILSQSDKKNKIMVIMTDGGKTSDGERSYEASRQALRAARKAGINIKSLLINEDSFASVIYRADNNTICDDVISVRDNASEIYQKIAYDMYQKIQDSLTSKYTPYRLAEGEQQYHVIKEDILEVEYDDGQATDKAGPTRPLVTLSETADRDGNIKMDIWSEDRGTSYEFYVKFVHPRTKEELLSNPTTQEVKTGVQGYAWLVDDNPTTDPGGTIRNLQFTFGKEYVGKWLHIRAVDWAGNWGDVLHIKIDTSRFISWEELNETKELFCVQHGQTIPAREDENHLNANVVAGSGEYKIDEVVADPKTGDRIGTRFVEDTTTNIYGTQDIYSYSLGKYVISPDTPLKRPGKEGNATDEEAYILNYYDLNDSLESAVQKAMYSTEISKGNITWDWGDTPESEMLVAEANAYAAYKSKGYEFSNIKLDSTVYMDEQYKDVLIGPFILKYDPQGIKTDERITYFASITGMKIYDQNDNVISELDKNGNNIGNIQAEFIYSGDVTATKRYDPAFSSDVYNFPVGYEEFYIKLKYKDDLDNVTKINKIDFIHSKFNVDAQYNVLVGTYNKVKWTPNRITSKDKDVLWCHDIENGFNICIHDKTYSHIIGCYFYLTATVYNSYREIPSQTLIDVLWTKSGYETEVQTLVPGSGEEDSQYPPNDDEETNDEWKVNMKFSGNIWNDGMEDKNDGIRQNIEQGVEKVRVNLYQVNINGNRTGVNYYTYSDNAGNYTLGNIIRGMYEIEFVYDGQTYKSTKMLVNGTLVDYKNDLKHEKYANNSIVQETEADRKELNEAYTEIAVGSVAIGGRGEIGLTYDVDTNTSTIQTTDNGYVKDIFAIGSRTSSYNLYYPISKKITVNGQEYIKIIDSDNVNFGLVERYKTDTSLKTDLYETIFSIKGNIKKYIFSERNIRDINSNIDVDEYIQEVNRADYNWTLEELLSKAPDEETRQRLLEILGSAEESELEAYLDYMIVIRNAGEKDAVQIAELANYYTKDLEYLTQYRDFDITSWAQVKYDTINEDTSRNKTDKIEIIWSENSKYDNSSNPYSDKYNKIYTTGLDREDLRVKKGEYLEVHIVFRVKKTDEGKIELDEDNNAKSSATEVNGYKTYYVADGKIAGLIDSDSQPGNANPTEDRDYCEDDEDIAPNLIMRLDDTANSGDSIDDGDGDDDINTDDDGNITGYGNVIEGNVWEDDRFGENIQKLANNQIIGDTIRQDGENLIQDINVELVEYFKHPTDPSRDVYLTIGSQKTRAVLSLSNGKKLDGGYSFINIPSGTYKTRFTYGNEEQLEKNLKYNGQDYQGLSTKDVNSKDETEKSYEDVEIMLVTDVSGSMNRNGIAVVRDVAEKITNGLYNALPDVKIGLTKFNNVAELISNPSQDKNKIVRAIRNLGSSNETAIGYGIENATDSYSDNAKKKIMIVLTDSEETVQNIEQVIKKIEIATDDNKIELNTILTKEHDEIFGTEEEPRRGNVYQIYNANTDEIVNNICSEIFDESQIESNRSSAKDLEGDANTPGTRAYGINRYEIMDLDKANELDIKSIEKLTGEERQRAIETLARETYMQAESKLVKFDANNIKISDIHELNLALMERPKTKLTIDTKINTIKVVLADGKTIIDTEKGVSKNVLGLDKEEVPITIYMDEEIMHGATLIVESDITIKNEGEIDSLSNYFSTYENKTSTTSAKLVFNYTSKNAIYRDENNIWNAIKISDIKGKITDEARETLIQNDMKVYETTGFSIELYPKNSKEVENGTGDSEITLRATLSKVMTSENNESDLTFDSSMEIVERKNTVGRRAENEIPGNYIPDTIPLELDAIKSRKITITKPWGENKSTNYIIIAIGVCMSMAVGIGTYKYIDYRNKKDKFIK